MEIKLHNLTPAAGSKKKAKRIGRGRASGSGKTSGRGQTGQRSRSGNRSMIAFEGGQMPLQRRLPKRGFTNIFKKEYNEINVSSLAGYYKENETVDAASLKEKKLIKKIKSGVKLLGAGKIEIALTVKANKASKKAVEKIEKAGGKVEII